MGELLTSDPRPGVEGEQRRAAERRVTLAATGYAACYAVIAGFCIFATVVPLHRSIDPLRQPWPNLWGLNQHNGSVRLGEALVIAEVLVLVLAAVLRPRGPILHLTIALLAVPELAILTSNVGMPDGVRLTGAGAAAITVGILGMAIAATAAAALPWLARRAASGGCQRQ